ncbi:UNVERIFIED_CONTAM: hypothetical protein GTU68_052476 [Idotea baltica]|nr:hypothetical protein [Idotea baltica]
MLFSTTALVSEHRFGDSFYYLKRQSFAALIGVVLLIIVSKISPTRIRKISPFGLIISLVLLLLLYIPGVGMSAGGARRWLNLGFMTFQPVELVKVLFVLFISGYFARQENKLQGFFKGVLQPVLYFVLLAFFLLMQPDFGSSFILGVITLVLCFSAGSKISHLLLSGFTLAMIALPLIITSPYRMKRILAFMAPTEDAQGKGYQLIQSLIAVSGGGFSGAGLGASQQKLHFLPAAHTDFAFAVICEELGFIGGAAIVFVFSFLFYRGMRLAAKTINDTFLFCSTIGLTLLITIPAFFNMGVVIGLLPTKGLALPFISYGGSSIVVSLFIVGIILSISRTVKNA